MSESAGVEVDWNLDLELANVLPCEHSGHDVDVEAHDDGPAKWYLMLRCPACEDTDILAVCDRWKHMAETNQMDIICDEACNAIFASVDWVVMIQPIGEGK